MKKLVLSLLIVSLLFLTTGCSKENLSNKEITKILEEQGFIKEDVKYTMEETADYENYKNIFKFSNSIYEFDYFELVDKELAIKLYEQNKEVLEKFREDSSFDEKTEEDYSRYSYEKDDSYYVLVRKGKTFLFGVVTTENKSDFNKVLSSINY